MLPISALRCYELKVETEVLDRPKRKVGKSHTDDRTIDSRQSFATRVDSGVFLGVRHGTFYVLC